MSESVIIGVDHGYAAMKTAHFSFHTGLVAHEHEPYTLNNVLEYGGKYYVVGSGRQPLQKDKTQTEDSKRKSALHDPADPVFHRPVLSAADGCCGQSKGTAARGKTHGADRCVKPASIFLCVLLSWTDKTVRPFGAVRETAMGSRSPAGPRRLGTATRISASLSRRLSAFSGSALTKA